MILHPFPPPHPFFLFFCWPVPQLLSPWYISLWGVQRIRVKLPNWSEKAGSTERAESQVFSFLDNVCLHWLAELNCRGQKPHLYNWKRLTFFESIKSIRLIWWINYSYLNHNYWEKGGNLQMRFVGLDDFFRRGCTLEAQWSFCTFSPLLQPLEYIGLRFLCPWTKSNCHTEWTVVVF